MRFDDLYKLLSANKFYVFSFEELCSFYPSANRTGLKQLVSRWKRSGLVSSLRKGLYELTFPSGYAISDMHIANRIYSPSYVSLETALSHYSIIPEVSMAVTSITSKPTRRFKNKRGLFIYRSVKPKAFTGYRVEDHGGFNVFIAEPEKALADYIYFRTLKGGRFDPAAERLDAGRVAGMKRAKLNSYAALYGIDLKEVLNAYL